MLLTIEVIREEALSLLSNMERLDLIRLNSHAKSDAVSDKKISKQFAGALHLSDTAYEAFQNTLRENRKEWREDTY